MTDTIDYDALDPGIRETVRALRAANFRTTDSGDGRTKTYDWALPFPHVVVVPHDDAPYIETMDRLRDFVAARYLMPRDSGVPRWEVELSVAARQGAVSILLRGVEDRYLRSRVVLRAEIVRGSAGRGVIEARLDTFTSGFRPEEVLVDYGLLLEPEAHLAIVDVGERCVLTALPHLDANTGAEVITAMRVLALYDGAGDDIRLAPPDVSLESLKDTEEETPLRDIEALVDAVESQAHLRRIYEDELVRVRGWLESWIGIGDHDMGPGTEEEV